MNPRVGLWEKTGGNPREPQGIWRPSIPSQGGVQHPRRHQPRSQPHYSTSPPASCTDLLERGIRAFPRGRPSVFSFPGPSQSPRLTSPAPWTQCTLLLLGAPLPQLLIKLVGGRLPSRGPGSASFLSYPLSALTTWSSLQWAPILPQGPASIGLTPGHKQ